MRFARFQIKNTVFTDLALPHVPRLDFLLLPALASACHFAGCILLLPPKKEVMFSGVSVCLSVCCLPARLLKML